MPCTTETEKERGHRWRGVTKSGGHEFRMGSIELEMPGGKIQVGVS
jgi:hypothetical protein